MTAMSRNVEYAPAEDGRLRRILLVLLPFVVAVIVVGIAWMFGYLDLRKAAYVVLGVAIVFGASEIVSTLTGS